MNRARWYVCPECEGSGVIEYKKDIGFSPYDDDYFEGICKLCGGYGCILLTEDERKDIELRYKTILEEW